MREYRVLEEGMQKVIHFYLEINILKRNFEILLTKRKASPQKVGTFLRNKDLNSKSCSPNLLFR